MQVEMTPPKSVAIIGYAWASLHLIPWDAIKANKMEAWGMNDLYVMPHMQGPFTAWFQMHPEKELLARFQQNSEWMKQKHPFPIFTQKVFDWCPNSAEYPLKEVMSALGRDYITNTVSLELGLFYLNSIACREDGYTDLYLYGVDMATGSEYNSQRPSCEYLIGLLEGKGVRVHIPSECDLLKAGRLYGYEVGHTIKDKIQQRSAELDSKIDYQKGQLAACQDSLSKLFGAKENNDYYDRAWAWDGEEVEWSKPIINEILKNTVMKDGAIFVGSNLQRPGLDDGAEGPPANNDNGPGHVSCDVVECSEPDGGSAHEVSLSTEAGKVLPE